MKCVNCGHERGFHTSSQWYPDDEPCALTDCVCVKYIEPAFIDKHLALREAVNVVQEYQAKKRGCKECKHDLDKHYEQMVLPIDDIVGSKVKEMRCMVPSCGCENFQ